MQNNFGIKQLDTAFNDLNSQLGNAQGKVELLNKQINTSTENIDNFKDEKMELKKCIEVLTVVQEMTINKTQKGFEDIVSNALQYIKGEDFKLKLEFSRRGNAQELKFNTISEGCNTPFDPKDKDAGGVLDILSLALRVVILELYRPKLEGFLALDEPFRNLSTENLLRARKFLEVLNKRFGRQIIMVTHKNILTDIEFNVIKL